MLPRVPEAGTARSRTDCLGRLTLVAAQRGGDLITHHLGKAVIALANHLHLELSLKII